LQDQEENRDFQEALGSLDLRAIVELTEALDYQDDPETKVIAE